MRIKTALLTLLTIIQYVEKLTDVEMSESIQRRMELRYALHLATPSPRLDPHSLCAFRRSDLTEPQCRHLFEEMFKHIYPEITSTAMKEEPNIDDVIHSICENEVRASLDGSDAPIHGGPVCKSFQLAPSNCPAPLVSTLQPSMVVANLDATFRKQELTREDIEGDIQHLLYEIRKSTSRDIMEMPETKNLNLIWEQLTDAKSIRNCNHCINMIH